MTRDEQRVRDKARALVEVVQEIRSPECDDHRLHCCCVQCLASELLSLLDREKHTDAS